MESQLDKHELLDLGFNDIQSWYVTVTRVNLLKNPVPLIIVGRQTLSIAILMHSWPNGLAPEIKTDPVEVSGNQVVFEIIADAEIPEDLINRLKSNGVFISITNVVKKYENSQL